MMLWGGGKSQGGEVVDRMPWVRVRPGSPFLTIDRTWETTCSVASERGRGRRSKRSMEQIRAEREERARRWRQLLEDGTYPSRAALARGEGVSRAAVTQGLWRW